MYPSLFCTNIFHKDKSPHQLTTLPSTSQHPAILKDDWAHEMRSFWPMGEHAAMRRLEDWLKDAAWGCYFPPGLTWCLAGQGDPWESPGGMEQLLGVCGYNPPDCWHPIEDFGSLLLNDLWHRCFRNSTQSLVSSVSKPHYFGRGMLFRKPLHPTRPWFLLVSQLQQVVFISWSSYGSKCTPAWR